MVSLEPAEGETAAPLAAPIVIALSDYPDPESVGLQTIVLTSGVFRRTGTYQVDLPARRILFRPTVPLDADLGFALTVFDGLRSLQGCHLAKTEQHLFRTGADATPPLAPAPVAFSDVEDVFARACAGGCHRAFPRDDAGAHHDGGFADAVGGLDLSDDAALAALTGVPAREDVALARVAPRDGARSFLLRKMLPDLHPGAPAGAPAPPTPGHGPPPELADGDAALVGRWIDQGALP